MAPDRSPPQSLAQLAPNLMIQTIKTRSSRAEIRDVEQIKTAELLRALPIMVARLLPTRQMPASPDLCTKKAKVSSSSSVAEVEVAPDFRPTLRVRTLQLRRKKRQMQPRVRVAVVAVAETITTTEGAPAKTKTLTKKANASLRRSLAMVRPR